MKQKRGFGPKFLILTLGFFLVFFGSFWVGRYDVSPVQTLRILLDWLLRRVTRGALGLSQTWQARQYAVVVNVRLPRVAAAALVGAALSTAGCAYQGMFRNPMVSPDLLGASTGAGFGAALGILLGLGYGMTTTLSFAFGLLAVILAYLISRVSKIQPTLAMVLAGVMISSLFTSGTSFIKLVADTTDQLPAITYWLMGSLTSVKARDVNVACWPVAIGLVPLWLLRWRVNLLTVSEAEARSMGVDTAYLRVAVVLCATLMTAGSVAISGMIGWVGLVIPHFGRMIFGQDYRRLIPASGLLGAVFLMVVDNLARTMTTSEVPLGILTSFVGAPVFLYLILSGGSQRER